MLNQLSISDLTAKIARREVSAREATQACLDRIQQVDGKIHAFPATLRRLGRAGAGGRGGQGRGWRRHGSGTSPANGVPVGIKDVLVSGRISR